MPVRSVLTRRRFLGHPGALGGSSLVMTAMSSWDLMAGQAGARPQLTGHSRARVLVIGTGISGLVVGYEHRHQSLDRDDGGRARHDLQ